MSVADDGPPAGIARDIARLDEENARLLARLGEGERRFRLISRGIVRLQEAERGRISRELHDGVGQSLTALKMRLEMLERDAADPALLARLSELREIAERSLQDVRHLSRLLRPQMLDELGLAPTLRWLARTTEETAGLAVELSVEGLQERVDPELETAVYRLAQEALANAARHSGARSAEVHLRRAGGRLALTVRDAGRGFDPGRALAAGEDDAGGGLRGMRDRVHLFGGRFAVRSAPGAGTAIEVELPLAPGD